MNAPCDADATAVAVAAPAGRRSTRRFVLAACAISAALAGLALAGWFSGHRWPAALLAGFPTMKANVAVCVLLLALAAGAPGFRWRWAALPAGALAAATALQDLTGASFGIDEWLVDDPWTAPQAHPGRMSAMSSLALTAVALGALLPPAPAGFWRRCLRDLPGIVAFAIGYAGSLGLLFGADWRGGLLDGFASFSISTSVAVLLLAAALLHDRPQGDGISQRGAAPSAGARFLRAVLPAATLTPAVIVWALLAARQTYWYDTGSALALASTLIAALFTFIVWRAARWIDGIEGDLQKDRALLEVRVAQRTAALRDAVADLQARREQLAAIVESATAGIVTIDAEQRVLLFNAAAEAMFGRRAEEVEGTPVDQFVPERHRAAHREHIARFTRTGESRREMGGRRGQAADLFGLRADGSEFPLEASISQVEVGHQRLLTVVLRDLGPDRALAAAREARAVAESANRAKSDFLSRVSHELRTPLNAVLGFAQLIEMTPVTPGAAQAQGWAAHIHRAGEHLLRLIDDLLDLSRVEAGTMEIRLQAVDLGELLEASCEMVSESAGRRGIRVDLRRSAVAPVLADRARLQQVLLNLLTNAVKYNRDGGEVTVWTESDAGRRVRVHVRDGGDGISAAQRARLFEPFNRLGREHGAIEGTGIGLALSRHLAERMGGGIEVDSTPGAGSRFTIVLRSAMVD